MNSSKKTNWKYLSFITFLAIAAAGLSYYYYQWQIENQELLINQPTLKLKSKICNAFLEVNSPQPNEIIVSPFRISGRSNFLGGDTGIRIKDETGKILTETFTIANGWMNKLYPFSKKVSYEEPSARKGTVEVFGEVEGSEQIFKITIPVILQDYKEE